MESSRSSSLLKKSSAGILSHATRVAKPSVSGLSPLPRRDNKDGLIPISWTSTRHDSCRPPSTAHDGYTAGASYRNEWSESDHHQECRGRFGRKGTARHRAAHFEHVGTLSIASVVSILKVAVVVPPFEPRLQQIYADSSRETVQHQQQQAKHRLRPLSVRYCRWVAAPFTSRRIGRPQVRACRAVHDHARAFIPKQVLPVN